MRLPENRIEAVCSKEVTRYALTHVNVRKVGKGWNLEASNGVIAVQIPADVSEGNEPAEGLIPVEAIKAARKKEAHRLIKANGDIEIPATGQTFKRPEGSFPDLKSVIPERASRAPDICISAEQLLNLAKALHADKATSSKYAIKLPTHGKTAPHLLSPTVARA